VVLATSLCEVVEPVGHGNDSVSPADCADQAIRGGGDTVVNGKDRYVLQGSHLGMNSDHPHDGSRRTSSGLAGTQLGQPGSGPMSLWQEAMSHAVDQARAAADWGDVPIGAVLLDPNGRVLAAGANERELTGDPTAHAEVVTIRRGVEALQARDEDDGWHLDDCTLVVTLEPCTNVCWRHRRCSDWDIGVRRLRPQGRGGELIVGRRARPSSQSSSTRGLPGV